MGRDISGSQGQVADAVKGNWVDRYAPGWLGPYLRLSRADRPAGTWLLLLPCWWGVSLAAGHLGGFGGTGLWIVVATALGAFLMRGAGCTWNDIQDRGFDAAVARTRSRPIPAGHVTARQALGWACLQSIVAFGILVTFHPAAIWLGLVSLAPVAAYPFAKRFTWWPQVFLGVAFNWGALLAWAALAGGIGWAPVFLYLSGLFWTLFYDTIYAYQDIEDDALAGVKSTARLFADGPRPWLAGFAVASVLLMAGAVVIALPPGLPRGVGGLAPLSFGAHLAWQFLRLDHRDPARCLDLFRSNRDAGLLAALFLAGAALV